MSNILFAKTRWPYTSYIDLHSLFTASGYRAVFVDEMDFESDDLYITAPMNGDFRAHMDAHNATLDRQCTIVHWLLERPDPSETVREYIAHNQELVDRGYVDFNIVSDPQLALDSGFNYVPMGSAVGLGLPGSAEEKEYDFVGLMSYTPRRAWLFDSDRPRPEIDGLKMAPNVDPSTEFERRHQVLQHSRFGLNVHKDQWLYCEPIRFALFAAYGLPIVTETLVPGTIYGKDAILEVDYRGIRKALSSAREHYERWAEWGAYLRTLMTGVYSFRNLLERYI